MECALHDRLKSSASAEKSETGLLPVGTFVAWISCVAVGAIGLCWPQLPAPVAPPKPIEAELMTIEAANSHPVLQESQPAAKPAAQDVSAPPDAPTVVAPSPAIAFAQPVNAPPTRIRAAPTVVTTQQAVIQITYGEGEGDQPPPDYPIEAQIAGEEGTVDVSLTVNEDGQVIDAVAVGPCRWPILNSAAVRSLRSTWRFRRGRQRVYRVSIVYQLKQPE
jgi:TonB family protein